MNVAVKAPSGLARRREPSIDSRSIAAEFLSEGLCALTRNAPFGNFLSREREIFSGPGKSSPVNNPKTKFEFNSNFSDRSSNLERKRI